MGRRKKDADKALEVPSIKPGLTVYLHFSFRKPKDAKYAVFAVACFLDPEFKKLITRYVTSDILWNPDSQHINSIQSYYKALEYIYNNQGDMLRNGISTVILVSGNSSLVNWILGRGRNTYYNSYVESISEPFRFGAPKEIVVGVGLLEAIDTEKSKKYCKPEYADNLKETLSKLNGNTEKKVYALDFGEAKKPEVPKRGRPKLQFDKKPEVKMRTIFDIMKEEEEYAPTVDGGLSEVQ